MSVEEFYSIPQEGFVLPAEVYLFVRHLDLISRAKEVQEVPEIPEEKEKCQRNHRPFRMGKPAFRTWGDLLKKCRVENRRTSRAKQFLAATGRPLEDCPLESGGRLEMQVKLDEARKT